MKKNRDPRWDKEFEFMCEQPPINDRMHVEVLSKPPKKGLIYSKVLWWIKFVVITIIIFIIMIMIVVVVIILFNFLPLLLFFKQYAVIYMFLSKIGNVGICGYKFSGCGDK